MDRGLMEIRADLHRGLIGTRNCKTDIIIEYEMFNLLALVNVKLCVQYMQIYPCVTMDIIRTSIAQGVCRYPVLKNILVKYDIFVVLQCILLQRAFNVLQLLRVRVGLDTQTFAGLVPDFSVPDILVHGSYIRW